MYNINNRAVKVIIEEVIEELKESLGGILDGADETLDSFAEVKKWLDEHKEEFDKHSEESEKLHKLIQDTIQELQEKHDAEILGVQTETKELVEGVQTSLSEEISNGLQTLSELVETVKGELEDKIEGVQEVFDGKIEGVQDELKENITGVQGEFDAKIEGVQGELTEMYAELETYIEGVQSELNDRIDGVQKAHEDRMTDIQNDLEISIEGVQSAMYDGFQSLGEEIDYEANRRYLEDEDIRTEMREGFQAAKDNLRGVQEAHEERMTGIQDDLENGLQGAQAELKKWIDYLLGNDDLGLDSFKETVEWIQGHQVEYNQLVELHENDVKGVQAQLALTREAVGIDGDVNVVDFAGAQYIETSTVREGMFDLDNSLKVEELARIKRDEELQASLGVQTEELLSKTFDYFHPKYQNIGKDASIIPGGEGSVNFLDGNKFNVAPTGAELHDIFVNGYTDDDTQETVYGVAAIKAQYGEFISVRGDYYQLVPQSRYIANAKNVNDAIVTIDKTISGLQDVIEDTINDNRNEFLGVQEAHEERMDGIQRDIETLDGKVDDNWSAHEDRFDGVQNVLTNVINTIGCGKVDGTFENNFDDSKYVTSDTVMGTIEDLDNALYDEEESRKDIDDKLQTIIGACDSELENKNIDFGRPTYVPITGDEYSEDEWEIIKNDANNNVYETVPTYDDYRDDYVNNPVLVPTYIRVGLGYYALQIGANYIDEANNLVAAVLKLDSELNRVETEVNTALDGAQAYTDSKVEYLEGVIEDGLQGAQNNLQNAVDTLNGRIDGNQTELEERISGVQNDLDDAVDQLLETIDGNQTELEERISGVQNDLASGLEGAQNNLQNAVDTLNTTIDGVRVAHEERMDGIQNDLATGLEGAQNNLQNAVDTLNTTIDGVQKDVDTRFAGVQGQFEFIMDNADKNYIDSFKEVVVWIQGHQGEVEEIKDSVFGDINDTKKKIDDEISKLKYGVPADQLTGQEYLETDYNTFSKLRERFKDVDDKIESVSNEIRNEFDEHVKEFRQDVADLNNHIIKSDAEHTNIRKELNDRIDGVQKDLTTGLEGAQSYVDGLLFTNKNSFDERINGVQNDLMTGLEGAHNDLTTGLEGAQSYVDDLLFTSKNSFDDRIKDLDKKLGETGSSLEELNGKHDSEIKDVNDKISSVKDEVRTVNDFTKGVQTQVETGLNDVQNNLQNAVDTLNTTIDGVQKDVDTRFAGAQSYVDNLLFNNRDSFDARIEGVQKDLVTGLEGAQSYVDNLLFNNRDSFDARIEGVQKDLVTGLEGAQNNLQNAVDTLNGRIDGNQTDIEVRVSGVQNDLATGLEGAQNNLKNVVDTLNGRIDGNQTELEERISGVQNDLDKSIVGIQKDVNARFDGVQEQFEFIMGNTDKNYVDSFKEVVDWIEGNQGNVEEIKDSVFGEILGIQTRITNEISDTNKKIDDEVNKLKYGVPTDQGYLDPEYNSFSKLRERFNDVNGEIERVSNEIRNEFDEHVKEFRQDVADLGSHITKSDTEHTNIRKELNDRIDGVQTQVESGLSGAQSYVDDLLFTGRNTFNDRIDDLDEKLVEAKNSLDTLSEKHDSEIKGIQTQVENAVNDIMGTGDVLVDLNTISKIGGWIKGHQNEFNGINNDVKGVQSELNGKIDSNIGDVRRETSDLIKGVQGETKDLVNDKISGVQDEIKAVNDFTKGVQSELGEKIRGVQDEIKAANDFTKGVQNDMSNSDLMLGIRIDDLNKDLLNGIQTINNRIDNEVSTILGVNPGDYSNLQTISNWINTHGKDFERLDNAVQGAETKWRDYTDGEIVKLNNNISERISVLQSQIDSAANQDYVNTKVSDLQSEMYAHLKDQYYTKSDVDNNISTALNVLDAYVKHSEYNDVLNTISNVETTLNGKISNLENNYVKSVDLARDYITKSDSITNIDTAISNAKSDMRSEMAPIQATADDAYRKALSAESTANTASGNMLTLSARIDALTSQLSTLESKVVILESKVN